ncbi:unnamed protein product [Lathyrus oleraceus]|uniref:Uncharacterized protein n=1 Tax=Pisum sativum TaxID=3888 RepID=A0A9D4XW97_PEA|nr:uncharacterized protein LOC127127060 [Pisum sativum]KAI5428621.1 hypothetical protein KIW84_033574 [Pisum sativum]
MGNWRKQQGTSHHQVGQWRSSSYNGKPPLDNRFPIPTVPLWEKKFCVSVGSVPWGKVVENKRYVYLHDNVMNWDDSAVKEAFDNAKYRFWAEINGFPCDIPMPDPNVYIDDVDSNASVDTELYLDLERELEVTNVEEKGEEVVIFGDSLILNQSFSGPGWGDEDGETKPFERNYDSPRLESNQHQNNETNSWEQCAALVESRNVNEEWNRREGYGGDLCHKYQQGRNGGNGCNRKRENNMLWCKNPGYHHGTNEYWMNRGRRRNPGGGGGRRGNFAYVDKGPTPRAW